MEEFEAIRRDAIPPVVSPDTTTLVIEHVPSKLAYKIITNNYAKGKFPSREELLEEYENIADPEYKVTKILQELIDGLTDEETWGMETEHKDHEIGSSHTPVWEETEDTRECNCPKRVCRCSECGAILGTDTFSFDGEHEFRTDYKTYKEFIMAEAYRAINKIDELRDIKKATPQEDERPMSLR